ncbi:MAG: hypothetical protein FWD31_01680 [Planctomycetaceae bacterium]|nr:hypothetical protein [Planctomycetaceae bacterium]
MDVSGPRRRSDTDEQTGAIIRGVTTFGQRCEAPIRGEAAWQCECEEIAKRNAIASIFTIDETA